MRAIFLSDAHLKGPGDAVNPKLIRLFDRLRGKGEQDGGSISDGIVVDHLVIAGDFFDFWFGRGDRVYPGFQPMIDRIAALKKQGVRVSFCEGNHDFFMGDYFTKRLGIEVYPEWAEFDIDGLRILVSHGDTVDRSNRKYLTLRRLLRSPFFRVLQRLIPLRLIWRLARLSSDMSKKISGTPDHRLAEVMHRFALEKFQEGYDAVILGHCHQPVLREAFCCGGKKTFATLGDWIANDSYLSCEDGRFSLNRLSPEG